MGIVSWHSEGVTWGSGHLATNIESLSNIYTVTRHICLHLRYNRPISRVWKMRNRSAWEYNQQKKLFCPWCIVTEELELHQRLPVCIVQYPTQCHHALQSLHEKIMASIESALSLRKLFGKKGIDSLHIENLAQYHPCRRRARGCFS